METQAISHVGDDEAAWPAALDALVAAPGNHTLLMENEHSRVLETRIAPGERTPVHTHRWPFVMYVLSWSEFVRYDADGNVLVDSRTDGSSGETPRVVWSDPLPPHSLLNVGTADIHVISVEMKDA